MLPCPKIPGSRNYPDSRYVAFEKYDGGTQHETPSSSDQSEGDRRKSAAEEPHGLIAQLFSYFAAVPCRGALEAGLRLSPSPALADVTAFLRLLPDWSKLSEGLNAIVLASGQPDWDGWYKPGVVAVCAWNRELWQEVSGQFYAEHRSLLDRLEVPCEPATDGDFLCHFTEASIRAYQLLHVLLHELGHHHDQMTTRNKKDCCRGESYAEQYALAYEKVIWDRYLQEFGLY